MNTETCTLAILDGYIPSSILAKDLGIESSDLRDTVLDHLKFKNVLLIKIPVELINFLKNKNYISTLLASSESERDYEYVIHISTTKKVGFWK